MILNKKTKESRVSSHSISMHAVVSALCHGSFLPCSPSCSAQKERSHDHPYHVPQDPSHPWQWLPRMGHESVIFLPLFLGVSLVTENVNPVSMDTPLLFLLLQGLLGIGQSDFQFWDLCASSHNSIWVGPLQPDLLDPKSERGQEDSGNALFSPQVENKEAYISKQMSWSSEVYGLQWSLPVGWVVISPLRTQWKLAFLWIQQESPGCLRWVLRPLCSISFLSISSFSPFLSFFFLFFFLTLLGLTCSLWKFSGSEMNQSCSSGLYYSHSNARSEPSVWPTL